MSLRPTLFAILLAATFQPALPQTSSPPLKARTQLVIVDVVVTDNKQNPVHNLTASDFTVLENNVPEHIKSFEEHTTASPAKPEQPLVLPPGNFTNYTTVPADASLNILLLDTLNTPNDAQTYVRNQIRLFLEKSPPNVPLAIFGLSSRLWLLQPFTADPRLLQAAVDNKTPRTSPLKDNAATGDKTDRLSEKMVEAKATVNPYVVQRLQQFEAEHSSGDLQLRARNTLDALNQLARYLAGLPGRKNLIWFSGSFPINILPDSNRLDPFAIAADNSDKFRQTTDLLSRSQVAVYPIDARGLTGPSVYSVESSGRQYDSNIDVNANRNQDPFSNNLNDSLRQEADDNSTMLQMAERTGGHAFINTNGLAGAVARSIEAGSNYYTLTYTPPDTANDGKFRRIQLKLRRDGYTLAYRRGYYADAPAPASSPTPVTVSNAAPHFVPLAAAPTANVADPMHNAMVFGSPLPTQITLKVLVVPAAGHPEDTLASGNVASANITGPYRRYDVTIAADPSAIIFTPAANGNHHASLLFRTYVYSRDGRLINASSRIDDSDLAPTLYERALHSALFFHQEISVPVKGEFYLRIGVHDDVADHDGAVEIPVDSVKDLPPLTLPPVAQPLARRH
jgi:VWFA-related protein